MRRADWMLAAGVGLIAFGLVALDRIFFRRWIADVVREAEQIIADTEEG